MDINRWLQSIGLNQYASAFAENHIDEDLLSSLNHEELKDLGVSSLGHRLRILKSIERLNQDATREDSSRDSNVDRRHENTSTERRQLTVMFCDLVGSTALAENMDPEDYRQIIVRYREAIKIPLDHYGGFIAEYQGDGVLVYFGYPNAHDDDATRAVNAGLDIIDIISDLKFPTIDGLKVRIGVATGVVITDQVITGNHSRKQDALGGTTNVASRLQTAARPGTVIITDSTRRLIKSGFDLKALGKLPVKGLEMPIDTWKVNRLNTLRGQRTTRENRLPPMVGRSDEMDRVIQFWQTAKQGSGRVVVLSGDPGIGKTRIVQELYRRIPKSERATMQFFGSPLHTNSAFYPIVEHIEHAAGFSKNDSREIKLAKFEKRLDIVTDDTSQAETLLGILLAMPQERHRPVNIAVETQRLKWVSTFAEQIKIMSRRRPVLMIVEDAHWIDPTTMTVLNEVIRKIENLPVLAVITHRPEFEHAWSQHAYVERRTLKRLGKSDSLQIVDELSSRANLALSTAEAIVNKTDGVPLFIEELTKWLLEMNDSNPDTVLTDTFVIPETLQDSLMARLDRLGAEKDVAQLAAIIGRQFSFDVLCAISDMDKVDLHGALQTLIDSGLVEPAVTQTPDSPPEVFVFKHALIQEAAYNSLLNSTRVQIHARLGHILDSDLPQVAAAEPEVVARHYEAGNNYDKATEFWIKASQQTARQLAFVETISHLESALQTLQKIPIGSQRQQLEMEILLRLGRSWVPLKGYGSKEVQHAFERAQRIGEDHKDDRKLIAASLGLTSCYILQGNLLKAHEIGIQCQTLTEKTDDAVLSLKTLNSMGVILLHMGELKKAHAVLENGIQLSKNAQIYWRGGLQNPLVSCLSYDGLALLLMGYPDRAEKKTYQAVRMAEELDSPYSIVFALCSSLTLKLAMNTSQDFLNQTDRAIRIARRRGFQFWELLATHFRDWYQCVHENDIDAIDRMRQTLQTWDSMNMRFCRPNYQFCLADGLAHFKRYEEATNEITLALHNCGETHDRVYEAELYRLQGDIFRAQQCSMAGEMYERCLSVSAVQAAKHWQLRGLLRKLSLDNELNQAGDTATELDSLLQTLTEGYDRHEFLEAKQALIRLNAL